MPVAAGDDHHIVIGRELDAADGVFKAVTDDLLGQREAGAVGKIRPVVRHNDGKAALGGKFDDVQRNMTAAEDKQPFLRQHRFADKCGIPVLYGRNRSDKTALEILLRGDGGKAAA